MITDSLLAHDSRSTADKGADPEGTMQRADSGMNIMYQSSISREQSRVIREGGDFLASLSPRSDLSPRVGSTHDTPTKKVKAGMDNFGDALSTLVTFVGKNQNKLSS
jgi:hypothetical protein